MSSRQTQRSKESKGEDNWDVIIKTIRDQQIYNFLQPISWQHPSSDLTRMTQAERQGWKRQMGVLDTLYKYILQFIFNTVSYIPTCAISFWQKIRKEVNRLGFKYNLMVHYILYTMVLSETKCYCCVKCYIRSELCSKLVILNIAPRWFKKSFCYHVHL